MGERDLALERLLGQSPDVAARRILGRYLQRRLPNGNIIEGRIAEVSAWEFSEEKPQKFGDYATGQIVISNRYGHNLVDISIRNGKGCLTLVGADFIIDEKLLEIRGPGKVSQAFHIDETFDRYNLLRGRELKIAGLPSPPDEIRVRSTLPENCLGYFYLR